jgi:energy-coupling factor transporter ATP-binding protein EcfA2
MTAFAYDFQVPLPGGDALDLTLEPGRSIIIIGANGSGKTRLGVYIENALSARPVHRIAAQKSLSLNDNISLISLERADRALRFGHPEAADKAHRWGRTPAIQFLSDFDALQQTLFAKHNDVASTHLQERKVNPNIPVPTTDLEKLKTIWDGLLPHRTLKIMSASIRVFHQPSSSAVEYPGSEMSDGERAIFYFLGQCLVALPNSALIIDEPEAHIHRAIVGPLWDAIEKARPDCGFVYVTHDLEFAVSRAASAKYFIRAYVHQPSNWEIEALPEDTGLPEHVVAELVGSRKPVLFVEGNPGSLDVTIYRHQYANFTIVPIGSCEAVIHSVASYQNSAVLHRLGARGVVDGDHRDADEVAFLLSQGVHVLPVAEVENVLLLPGVFTVLAELLLCNVREVVEKIKRSVMQEAATKIDLVSARHTIRKLDLHLKRVEVKAKDLATLTSIYSTEIASIDPSVIFSDFKTKLQGSISAGDLAAVLALYDNKGLLAQAARILGLKDQKQLIEKVGRLLGNDKYAKLGDELTTVLPRISI